MNQFKIKEDGLTIIKNKETLANVDGTAKTKVSISKFKNLLNILIKSESEIVLTETIKLANDIKAEFEFSKKT